MRTTIYYYTATGNSLALARTIAQALGDAEVLPIARFRKQAASPQSREVGIIFPIHAWGPPRTVTEFAKNLDLGGVRYTFAIASCGGTAAGTLPKLRRVLLKNGGELHAGFIAARPATWKSAENSRRSSRWSGASPEGPFPRSRSGFRRSLQQYEMKSALARSATPWWGPFLETSFTARPGRVRGHGFSVCRE